STGAKQTLAAGLALNVRNAIAGDFNNDGVRDVTDVTELMSAVGNTETWAMAHHSGTTGTALGTAAVPEILGDFNGDGNFDSNDVRYFADGLAIATSGPHAGKLDRKAGFVAVDTAWTVGSAGHPAGNYFNTTIATGKAYAAGASRGDVAGSAA